jgi:hypothetical protein
MFANACESSTGLETSQRAIITPMLGLRMFVARSTVSPTEYFSDRALPILSAEREEREKAE